MDIEEKYLKKSVSTADLISYFLDNKVTTRKSRVNDLIIEGTLPLGLVRKMNSKLNLNLMYSTIYKGDVGFATDIRISSRSFESMNRVMSLINGKLDVTQIENMVVKKAVVKNHTPQEKAKPSLSENLAEKLSGATFVACYSSGSDTTGFVSKIKNYTPEEAREIRDYIKKVGNLIYVDGGIRIINSNAMVKLMDEFECKIEGMVSKALIGRTDSPFKDIITR